MPIRIRAATTPSQRLFGLIVHNPLLFLRAFFGSDLRIPARSDLPAHWHGRTLLTKEQRLMILDENPTVVFCTSRKVGKTTILESNFFRQAVLATAEDKEVEALVFAPREHHIRPLELRLRLRANKVPLFRTLLKKWNSSDGIVEFHNCTYYFRIEGAGGTGQNFVGLRASFAMGDEMGYFSRGAWAELQNTFIPGAKRIFAGVPRGIRDTPFYDMTHGTKRSPHLSIHRTNILANPIYHSRQAMVDEAAKHGGVRTQGFITQVLGEWGEEAFATFPVLPVASIPAHIRHARGQDLDAYGFANVTRFTIEPEEGFEEFCIAADIGLTASPTCIVIAGRKGETWFIRARVELRHTNTAQIAQYLDYINLHVLPQRAEAIALDAHGIGSGTIDFLHSKNTELATHDDYTRKAFDVGFGSLLRDPSTAIHRACGHPIHMSSTGEWVCDYCQTVIHDPQAISPAHIPARQAYMERLKDAFANGQKWLDRGQPASAPHLIPRLILPRSDLEMQEELGGITESRTATGFIRYTPGRDGRTHITDAVCAVMAGILRLEHRGEVSSDSASLEEYGWAPNPFQPTGWNAPWA
ncbi:MAG: hypothetical protein ACUVS5_12105 [Anaerolineae bacterium]